MDEDAEVGGDDADEFEDDNGRPSSAAKTTKYNIKHGYHTTHSLTHSLTHLLTHSLTNLLTHSLTHSLTCL